jgi:hypothetical protein
VFEEVQASIDSRVTHRKSNEALGLLRPGLEAAKFVVEGGKGSKTIRRPVHFGEFGDAGRTYRIDSYQKEWKLALEVEAGRALKGNAVYRDLIQTSLLVGVEFLALAVPLKYVYGTIKVTENSYLETKSILDAIYSSDRLQLPLRGILLIGY